MQLDDDKKEIFARKQRGDVFVLIHFRFILRKFRNIYNVKAQGNLLFCYNIISWGMKFRIHLMLILSLSVQTLKFAYTRRR